MTFSKPDASAALVAGILTGLWLLHRSTAPDISLLLIFPAAMAWGYLAPVCYRLGGE